jgi:crotonobetainyl-CoA:carnitine CoA-transferase CaiB-like acyl-CoA transferase
VIFMGSIMPPLDGLTVLDFSRVLAGPYCTMQLADLGARVIKIEQPGRGDDTRAWGPPFVGNESAYFLSVNRNKESLALDLKHERSRPILEGLLARADVVVENFRPGTMARLGLGYGQIAERYPRIVYCAISGFGQTGPRSAEAGYDAMMQAEGGLMSITGAAGGPPFRLGVAIGDIATGMFAVQGILAALFARERQGRGQLVDIAMLDAVTALLTYQASIAFSTGETPVRMGNRHPSIAPYETFRAADGDFAVAVGNDAIFARLCGVIGRPELADDPRFATNAARLENREELGAILEGAFHREPAADWVRRLSEGGVPAGPINDIGEAFAFAEALGLDPVWEVDGVRGVRSPLKLSDTPAAARRRPPALGEHDDELRAWLEAG